MSIQLPTIDLNGFAPVIGLVLIAVVALIVIVVIVALRSKAAMIIALILGATAVAPMLVGIVGAVTAALVPLALIVVAGIVAIAAMVTRSPDLAEVIRDLRSQATITQLPTPNVIKQLPDGNQAKITVRRTIDQGSLSDWGF
jgi:hypothetical protein